jgi:hypothetical protein
MDGRMNKEAATVIAGRGDELTVNLRRSSPGQGQAAKHE